MARLTVHVFDTARDRPASGVRVELYCVGSPGDEGAVVEAETNADGRTPVSLLEGETIGAGTYRLAFHVGAYFARTGHGDARRFLDVVPVVIVIDTPAGDYDLSLRVSPWGYSVNRDA